MTRKFWRLAVPLAGFCLAACSGGETGSSEDLRLEVEYAGCAELTAGPLCALHENDDLTIWARARPGARIDLAVDGEVIAPEGIPVDGGHRFAVSVSSAASRLEVRARAGGRRESWTLRLGRADPRTLRARISKSLRGAPDLAAHEAVLRAMEDDLAAASLRDRGAALALVGNSLLRLGEHEAARAILLRAVGIFRQGGDVLAETTHVATIVWIDVVRRRHFAEAREALDSLRPRPDAPAEAKYFVAYSRGLLGEEVGDLRTAFAQLQAAVELAGRLGLKRYHTMANEQLGLVLLDVGQTREAAELYRRLRAETEGAAPPSNLDEKCDLARLLGNEAWALLLAREAGEESGAALPLLEKAQSLFGREICARVDQQANLVINLALAHLQDGRIERAREDLEQARELAEDSTEIQRLWWIDIAARIALGDGRPREALELYERLGRLAASTGASLELWRATVGRAHAQAGLAQPEQALSALAEAEALADREGLEIPLYEGRESFFARSEAATALRLELLLAGGRDAEALAVARRARSRVLRALRQGHRLAHLDPGQQERWDRALGEYRRLRDAADDEAAEDWRRPADELARLEAERARSRRKLRQKLDQAFSVLAEDRRRDLPALRSGEAVLAYHPLAGSSWVGFAALDGEVRTHRFEWPADPSPPELAARLLEPFADVVERAQRVRILPYGPLRDIDFHLLPFGSDVLLAARPVVYGLDLERPAESGTGGRRALVVADPLGDLPAARREADRVHRILGRSWQVTDLRLDAADATAVRGALARADFLHYSGHATFGGWESSLELAASGRLSVGDILALERAPRLVVLSGCETGRAAAGAVESIGLAQAFLVAGSAQVIAAVRPVEDRLAEKLFAELYGDGEGRSEGAPTDAAVLLRQAQLRWRERFPKSDWASFRVLEP